MQEDLRVAGEIVADRTGRGENGDPLAGVNPGSDHLDGALAALNEIAGCLRHARHGGGIQAHVIEKQGDVARGRGGRIGRRRTARTAPGGREHGKRGDGLRLAVIEKLKIRLLQPGYGSIAIVAHHHRHFDEVRFRPGW